MPASCCCASFSRAVVAATIAAACLGFALAAQAAPVEPVRALAASQKGPLLDTLQSLVAIESGSGDREGLDALAALIAGRLIGIGGGQVETIEPEAGETYRMVDTPKAIGKMVRARFAGAGSAKILLIAHMDTVYLRGMLARQLFRIDGKRAYGLGIADDKQGIAVIIHTLAILEAMRYRNYGLVTVLINADEEVSSPGSRAMLTRLGGEHDAVLSFESSRVDSDRLLLTTAGIAAVLLDVEGKASHAGSAPERGRNALYELAHQILQTRDLSDPTIGLKMNWTIASAGTNRNVIPAVASAVADVRVLRVADYDAIEHKVRERMRTQLIPDTQVKMTFERRRPPLEMTEASRALASRAQRIYSELGMDLTVGEVAEGGGTDAAFAALATKAPVIERFGLRGFGAHSNDAEYIDIDSIEPRLYLAARLIMDLSEAKQPSR
jgi:glutamate carboxypeptidase